MWEPGPRRHGFGVQNASGPRRGPDSNLLGRADADWEPELISQHQSLTLNDSPVAEQNPCSQQNPVDRFPPDERRLLLQHINSRY